MNEIIIQTQYKNTNIETLINGIIEIRNKHRIKALEALKNNVMDLKNASGDALDLWGRMLNFTRFIPVDTQEGIETFQNFNFYDRNFRILKFPSANDLIYAKLDDMAYRKVLQIIYYNFNAYSNLYNASELATEIFENDIFVGDSFNMEYITYYFRDEIPKWLQWILTKYDVLPRPVCVGTRFKSVIWKIFSFITDGPKYNSKISVFFNSQFLGDRKWQDASGIHEITNPNAIVKPIKPPTPTSQSPILATYNQTKEIVIGNIQPNATLNIKNVNTTKANVELKAGTNDTLLYTAITQDRTYHYVELTQTLNNETSDKLTIEFKLNGV